MPTSLVMSIVTYLIMPIKEEIKVVVLTGEQSLTGNFVIVDITM